MLTPPPAAVPASPMESNEPTCVAAGRSVSAAGVCPAAAVRLAER